VKTYIRAPKEAEVKRLPTSPLQEGPFDPIIEGICGGIQGVLGGIGCDNEDPGIADIVCNVANSILTLLGCDRVEPPLPPPPECTRNSDCDEFEICNPDDECEPDPDDCRGGLECGSDQCNEEDGQCYECLDNTQCPAGWSCVENDCQEGIACTTDEECPELSVCQNELCEVVGCTLDEHCNGENICDAQTHECVGDPTDCRSTLPGKLECEQPSPICLDQTGECVECETDPDCSDGQFSEVCVNNACENDPTDCRWNPEASCPTAGEMCDEFGNCVADPDHCLNAGCVEWEHCDIPSGNCQVDIGRCNLDSQCTTQADPACNLDTHFCAECYTDGHCNDAKKICDHAGGYQCVLNPNHCANHQNCPSGYVCDFGGGDCICSSPPCNCATDADCAFNEDCISAQCVVNPDACSSDSDCTPFFERCVNDRCESSCTSINKTCGDGSSSCDCTCCPGLTCEYHGFPEFDYKCGVP